MEHRLAGEDPAGEDAVEAADEVVAGPHLDAVGHARPVEGPVGGPHVGGEPRLGAVGAAGEDGGECPVHGRLPAAVPQPAPQRARHGHVVGQQDGPGMG